MTWYLHVQHENDDGVVARLPTRKDVLIGRNDECNVRIGGPRISRRHCRLHIENDQWMVEDLGSRNGSLVNGTRVEHAAVNSLTMSVVDRAQRFVGDVSGLAISQAAVLFNKVAQRHPCDQFMTS